jgi:hypothetical protein
MVAGLVAGALAFGFARVFGEPSVSTGSIKLRCC